MLNRGSMRISNGLDCNGMKVGICSGTQSCSEVDVQFIGPNVGGPYGPYRQVRLSNALIDRFPKKKKAILSCLSAVRENSHLSHPRS